MLAARSSAPRSHLVAFSIAPLVAEELVGTDELDNPSTDEVALAAVVAVAVARKLFHAEIVALGGVNVPAVVPDP